MPPPLIIDMDGFEHQRVDVAQGGSGFIGVYDAANRTAGLTFDTAVKRTARHVASLVVTSDNVAATNLGRTITFATTLVGSFYFRVAAAPAANVVVCTIVGPTSNPNFQIRSTGELAVGFSSRQVSPNVVTDGLWHRVDFSIFTSTTVTNTIDWQLDGIPQTQATIAAQVSAGMTAWRLGSTAIESVLATRFQDFVLSSQASTYPIGPHVVLPLYPQKEGTDNLLAHIVDEGALTTNLWTRVADWAGGGTPDTATYVVQNTIDASAYAEFKFNYPVVSQVWDVQMLLAGFASTTGADTADARVHNSAGTLIDSTGLVDYSGSTTVLGYHRRFLVRPATGWSSLVLGGSVLRWGFATDVIGQPRLSAAMLEYAGPELDDLVVPRGLPRLRFGGARRGPPVLAVQRTDLPTTTTVVTVDVPGAVQWAGSAVTTTIGSPTTAGAVQWAGSAVATTVGQAVDVAGAVQWSGQAVSTVQAGSWESVTAQARALPKLLRGPRTGPRLLAVQRYPDFGGGATTTVVTVDVPGASTWTGSTVVTTVGLPVVAGAVTWLGSGVVTTVGLPVVAGAATWTGSTVVLAFGSVTAAGAVTWLGSGVTTTVGSPTTAGAVQWAGAADVNLRFGFPVTAGAVQWAGAADVNLRFGDVVSSGAVTWLGSAADTRAAGSWENRPATARSAQRLLRGPGQGPRVLARQQYPDFGVNSIVISVDVAGAIQWTGSTVVTTVGSPTTAGAVTWTGSTVALKFGDVVSAGAETWAGQGVVLNTKVNPSAGAATWLGSAVSTTVGLQPDAGAVLWTGSSGIDLTQPGHITVDTPGHIAWGGAADLVLATASMAWPASSASVEWPQTDDLHEWPQTDDPSEWPQT